jgi:hypothetical protein
VISISGCAGLAPDIPQDRTIMITATEPRTGQFNYGGLLLDYAYTLTVERLNLSGVISYRDSFDSLDVRILFLDAAGKVLGRKLLYMSGYRTGLYNVTAHPFDQTFDLPAGCVAFTFTASAMPRTGHK